MSSFRALRRSVVSSAAAALALTLAAAAPARAQEIALTFDDLPAHSALPPGETRLGVAQKIIAALKAARAPRVWGFVNGVQEEREPESRSVLPAWRAAGFPLGNHTWSHMNLNQRSLADWEADVLKNEPVLQAQMGGQDWRWLRFPFLAEGDTPEKQAGARAFLAEHGYRAAGVTMSFGDYAFNEPYARCAAKGDAAAIAQLEAAYLKGAMESVVISRGLATALYGRDIPYVLLMHLGAFDARMLPRLLAQYKAEGFRFVTLEEAERHPFYRTYTDLRAPPGPANLETAVRAKGVVVTSAGPDFRWLEQLCR